MPSLGIGHVNARNKFCLADDLMEPFRPLVDRMVRENSEDWASDITPDARSELAGMMACSIATDDGDTDLFRVMTLVTNSLVALFEGNAKNLYLPREIAFVKMPRLPGMEARNP